MKGDDAVDALVDLGFVEVVRLHLADMHCVLLLPAEMHKVGLGGYAAHRQVNR